MAYIAPTSTITLYENIPLDPSYRNTVYFADKQAQDTYFNSDDRNPHQYSNQMYQRADKGTLRIKEPIGNIYGCNYLSFINDDSQSGYYKRFERKKFYAFITGMEYINNEVTEVSYEIDVMQTFMFDVVLKPSFVEREHVAPSEDTIGNNINPEPLSIPDQVINEMQNKSFSSDVCFVVTALSTMIEETSLTSGFGYDGIPSSFIYFVFNNTTTDRLRLGEFLDHYGKGTHPENLVSAQVVPSVLIDSSKIYHGSELYYMYGFYQGYGTTPYASSFTLLPSVDTDTTLDGYKPINAKLYTYPYNYAVVYSSDGSNINMRYEFCKNKQVNLSAYGTIVSPVAIAFYPKEYKNSDRSSDYSLNLTIQNFPQFPLNTSAAAQTFARSIMPMFSSGNPIEPVYSPETTTNFDITPVQRRNRDPRTGKFTGGTHTVNQYMQTGQTTEMVETGAQLSGAFALGAVSTLFSAAYQSALAPNSYRGSISNGNVLTVHHLYGLHAQRLSVPASIAKAFDNFFSMYGYATNRVKIPNTHSRPLWNYVKTAGAIVEVKPDGGKCPADVIEQIEGIYDRGITFWMSPFIVGEYLQSDGTMYPNK